MNRTIFPLEAGRQGSEVVDLQAALQLLLDRGGILPDSEGTRSELSTALRRERAEVRGRARAQTNRRAG